MRRWTWEDEVAINVQVFCPSGNRTNSVNYASIVKMSHYFWDLWMIIEWKRNIKNFCLASTVAGQKCTTAQAALDMGCCYLNNEHVTISIQVLYCCWQHERIMATINLTQHERIMATNILISDLFSFLGSFCMSLSVLQSSMGSTLHNTHADSLWVNKTVDASSTC